MKPELNLRRFTIDGSDELEARLAALCQQVRDGVEEIVAKERLEALVLAGGYGRGQGGVLRTSAGERPYNDLEFYVFLPGNLLLHRAQADQKLRHLGEELSPAAGLHVEFKVDSLAKLRRSAISMFTYDLVAGHRALYGEAGIFLGCEHHLESAKLPLCEATRLLLNRFTGLLLAKQLLANDTLTAEQSDFIGRNLAKAQLAMGDAVLTAAGQYHWNCLERKRRLLKDELLSRGDLKPMPWLEKVRKHHQAGVEFKLHPRQLLKSSEAFRGQHREISSLALQIWLWVESRRLGTRFISPEDYARSGPKKCAATPAWRNYLLNLKALGLGAAFDPLSKYYPRQRLLNTLPVLLWNDDDLRTNPNLLAHLQKQLRTSATQWGGFVSAYTRIWQDYG
jgi:hypothetical protein